MSTLKEKQDRADGLAKKLAAARASVAAAKIERNASRGGNGASAPAVPAPEKTGPAKRKTVGTKSAAKAPVKKPTAKPSAKKPPAKAKKPVSKKSSGPTAVPKIVPGLAGLANSKNIDSNTGLTEFQVGLCKVIEDAGRDGINIKSLIYHVWTKNHINKVKETKTGRTGKPVDLSLVVRNAIRKPVQRMFVERVDGEGLYCFIGWHPSVK